MCLKMKVMRFYFDVIVVVSQLFERIWTTVGLERPLLQENHRQVVLRNGEDERL